MYCEFFRLRELPFRESPDPRLLFRSARFDAAVELLTTALARRHRLVTLVGPAGVGKTLLIRHLMARAPATGPRFILLRHPDLALHEVADALVRALGGEPLVGAWRPALADALAHGEDTAHGVVLVIDEAQALPRETLVALPSLLEVGGRDDVHPLQILLSGQPKVVAHLTEAGLGPDPHAHAELTPLEHEEIGSYVEARLRGAGARAASPFTPSAIDRIARYADGVPRMVNVIADGCLLAAYRTQTTQISADTVKEFWTQYLAMGEGRTFPPVPIDGLVLRAPPPTPAPTVAASPAPAPTRETTRRETPAPRTPREGMLPPPTHYVAPHGRDARRGRPVAGVLVGLLVVAVAAATIAWRQYPHLHPQAMSPPRAKLPAHLATATVRTEPAATPAPSPGEAVDVLEEFRQACEARDAGQLRRTLAPTVRGAAGAFRTADTVMADFAPVFARLLTLVMVQPAMRIRTEGGRTTVEASFEVHSRDLNGLPGWSFGVARWELERRDGHVQITGLDLEPGDLLSPRVRNLPAT